MDNWRQIKVSYVEDDFECASYFAAFTENFAKNHGRKLEVRIFTSAEQFFDSTKYDEDYLLVDYHLPTKNGLMIMEEYLKNISNKNQKPCKFYLITAANINNQIQSKIDRFGAECLLKPIALQTFAEIFT